MVIATGDDDGEIEMTLDRWLLTWVAVDWVEVDFELSSFLVISDDWILFLVMKDCWSFNEKWFFGIRGAK